MSRSLKDCHVLVTGATGLIGGELALELSRRESERIYCLVRGRDGEAPSERTRRRFERSGRPLTSGELARAVTIAGDVTRGDLGMESPTLEAVRDQLDLIIHCAAETSFIRSQNCRDINIHGMQRLIEFARGCERQPLIVYISTACNVGAPRKQRITEEDGCQPDNQHFNAYTHSKAIAETMLRESGLPHLVIRPSIVMGAGIPDDEFARQILWIAPLFGEFESLPVNPAARLDIVPVSYVVNATLALIELPTRRHDCYHVSAGPDFAIRVGDLAALFNRHYGKPPVQCIPPSDWTRQDRQRYVTTAEQRRLFFALRHYLPFLNMDAVFDNGRVRSEIDLCALGLVSPTCYLEELLNRITLENAVRESLNP